MADRIAWATLVTIEPRLDELLAKSKAVWDQSPGSGPFCAHARWYGSASRIGLKDLLSELVGWDRGRSREKPVLDSEEEVLRTKSVAELEAEFAPEPPPSETLPPHLAELMRSEGAYDVAYQTVYTALPDCEPGCGCV